MLQRLRFYAKQLGQISKVHADLRSIQQDLMYLRESLGRVEARQTIGSRGQHLGKYEFRVYSQWGEDGIIQYLINNISIPDKSFIEFGVESYQEANTRFLLVHDNWRGLIIDGSKENTAKVQREGFYWQYNLTAVNSFITPSNVNDLFTINGFSGEIGLLSVDIDGMDYWVWKNITVVSPAIVVVEYNARFGPDRAATIALDDKFTRADAHYSMIYFGASLAALVKLGTEKGYSLLGCNSNGNNAFFVRNDLMPQGWKALTSAEAYVPCRFRESRNENGELSFIGAEKEAAMLFSLPLVDV